MLDGQAETQDLVVTEEEVRIPSGGNVLAGRLFRPKGEIRGVMVLNGATGVPHGYYGHFARWVAAERQMACLTYDYSDFGASATGHPRISKATMAQWALADQPAALKLMRQRFPGLPVSLLGHSLGAMLMPLHCDLDGVQDLTAVASGIVHHSDHPWPYKGLALSFWFGHVPLLVKALGYLPGKAVGFGEDLPAPVYWQWRRWCTTHGGYQPEVGADLPRINWEQTGIPVRLCAFSDDPTIPPHCVWRLGDVFGDVPKHRVLIDPKEYGLREIGHLGAFTRRNAVIWPELVPEVET